MNYPGIKRAALEIAYDNGAVNRFQSEGRVLSKLDKFIEQHFMNLDEIDQWLAAIPNTDLVIVCAGEYESAQNLLENAPLFTDTVLDDWFEYM